jgi:hypothetical protein
MDTKYVGVEIDRIMIGLSILKKYKRNPVIVGRNTANWVLEVQDEEFIKISEKDKEILLGNGWRSPNGMLWKVLSNHGIEEGK